MAAAMSVAISAIASRTPILQGAAIIRACTLNVGAAPAQFAWRLGCGGSSFSAEGNFLLFDTTRHHSTFFTRGNGVT